MIKMNKKRWIWLNAITVSVVFSGMAIIYFQSTSSSDSDVLTDETSESDVLTDDVTEVSGNERVDPYVDERKTLSEVEVNVLIEQTLSLAYEGQWLEIVELIEPLELESNLEDSENGTQLRSYYLDATKLVRLTAMGDNADTVEASIETLPKLNTEEFFVLGLYYLPRNVLLELSVDQLALAPTQRGYVELMERTDLPFTNDDGTANDEVNEHDTIYSYLNMVRENEYETGFVRFDVLNGSVKENIYVVHRADDTFGLVGFYSEDPSPANTTKTVDHYLNFRDDVSEGIEALLNEAQEDYEENKETGDNTLDEEKEDNESADSANDDSTENAPDESSD